MLVATPAITTGMAPRHRRHRLCQRHDAYASADVAPRRVSPAKPSPLVRHGNAGRRPIMRSDHLPLAPFSGAPYGFDETALSPTLIAAPMSPPETAASSTDQVGRSGHKTLCGCCRLNHRETNTGEVICAIKVRVVPPSKRSRKRARL